MKYYLIILVFLTFMSCKNEIREQHEHNECEELDRVSIELKKFDKYLITLYEESKDNPENVIRKSDSLLIVNERESEKYKSQIKSNVESKLHYLKAELFYKIGKYYESINELNSENNRTGSAAIAYAANYVKLRDFKTAKSFIDSIGNWNGNYYALGNYYESIGDKNSALKTYKYNLVDDKSRKHFIYYQWTERRVKVLEENKPLLNEVFFPTGNPDFEICEICNTDNELRTKIMDLLQGIPENKKDWSSTYIVESPFETGRNFYWVKVEAGNQEFNYHVDKTTLEIKYFNPQTQTTMTLEEWRKSK